MIEIIRLFSKKNGHTILDDITLNIEKGELLSILGPSGSGKTSLLRMIAGLDRPNQGEIKMDGEEMISPFKWNPQSLRRVSMIFQDLALWPHMNVKRHIEFVINRKLYRNIEEVEKQTEKILSMIHLGPHRNRYPNELSGGEKQRLAIARALASEPEYLLMDEPFSNLDDLLKRELLEITLLLKKENGITIIYVTHNIDEALFLADKVVILNQGRIVKIWVRGEMEGLSKEEILRSSFRGLE